MENDELLMAAKTLVAMFLRNCCNCTYNSSSTYNSSNCVTEAARSMFAI